MNPTLERQIAALDALAADLHVKARSSQPQIALEVDACAKNIRRAADAIVEAETAVETAVEVPTIAEG